jgi:hypothetical protein
MNRKVFPSNKQTSKLTSKQSTYKQSSNLQAQLTKKKKMMNQVMCSDKECDVDTSLYTLHDNDGSYCECGNGYLRLYDYANRPKPLLTSAFNKLSLKDLEPLQPRDKIVLPLPETYELSTISAKQAYHDILRFTNNSQNVSKLMRVSADSSVIIGYIRAPTPEKYEKNIIGEIIGKNGPGNWFSTMIEHSGIYYAFYDKKTNNFLFWAPNRESVIKALSATRWKIMAAINN